MKKGIIALIFAAFVLTLLVWAVNTRYEYSNLKYGSMEYEVRHDNWTGKTWQRTPFNDKWELVKD